MVTVSRSRSKAGYGEALPLEDLTRALCHDVGNLLAAVRLSAYLLSNDIAETDRASISRDI